MYKFRSMADARGENENLLLDNTRLTKFGKALRATSMDELSDVFRAYPKITSAPLACKFCAILRRFSSKKQDAAKKCK